MRMIEIKSLIRTGKEGEKERESECSESCKMKILASKVCLLLLCGKVGRELGS